MKLKEFFTLVLIFTLVEGEGLIKISVILDIYYWFGLCFDVVGPCCDLCVEAA